ncbi:protein msta [Eurytemora carolleeae]|uniref:protein msta n=1 Tax=Eurytemora carolleeae TaxID=1294199 RepID=UPI000C764902|nr:protein msta [Eurytemora carolleeae]|eukprot:XP_023323535.1 protein msta-like [Eurytemora affinis]
MSELTCFLCDTQTTKVCEDCIQPVCSSNHMKIHRSNSRCSPFRVESGENGRFLVATRDIQPLEIILHDECFGFVPKLEHPPVCLVCWNLTKETCGKCGLPLCKKCVPKAHEVECEIIKKSGIVTADEILENPCILPSVAVFRFLNNNKHKEFYDRLVDNLSWIQTTEEFKIFNLISKFIRERCDLKEYSEELIWKILGKYKSNGCSVANYRARAIFPIFSMLNHSCISNARHIVNSEDQSIEVVSKTFIPRGDEINIRYTTTFLETITTRKNIISDTWNFDCRCLLCNESTENKTYLSAVSCQNCKLSHLLPCQGEESQDLVWKSQGLVWKCGNCKKEIKEADIESIQNKVSIAFSKVPKTDLTKLVSFASLCKTILHPKHALTLKVHQCILHQKIENIQLTNMKKEDLRSILNLSDEYISVVEVVDPGFSKWKSRIEYQTVRIELMALLQNVNVRNENPVSIISRCVSKLEEALAGMTGELSCLSLQSSSLLSRIEGLINHPNLEQGYSALLRILCKHPALH